jgi:hypothetical protein
MFSKDCQLLAVDYWLEFRNQANRDGAFGGRYGASESTLPAPGTAPPFRLRVIDPIRTPPSAFSKYLAASLSERNFGRGTLADRSFFFIGSLLSAEMVPPLRLEYPSVQMDLSRLSFPDDADACSFEGDG